jgi:hypothetical protein
MRTIREVRSRPAAPAILAVLLAVPVAVSNVDLVLQPVVPQPCASRYLDLRLYAFADGQTTESVGAMDVILSWDPAILNLQGILTMGVYPYAWLFSGFPSDIGLDGLNETWTDGDALYEALGQLGAPADVTSSGLLVTAFRFEKLRVGIPTTIEMPESAGMYTVTAVYSGLVPGLAITGTLEDAALTPGAQGDMNCDGLVNSFDIDPFVMALCEPEEYALAYPDCDRFNADTNCDGLVNAFDIDPFVTLLVGG